MPAASQNDETSPACKGGWKLPVTVLVLALLIRGLVLWALFDDLGADPDAYRLLAETFRQTGVFGWAIDTAGTTEVRPTASRPPLYPLVLAASATNGRVTSLAVACLHAMLGAGTVLLTFLSARCCGLGRWSLLAALLVAVDPILLVQSSLVMTETLAALLAVLGIYCLVRYSGSPTPATAIPAGAVLALAALCRPTFLPWLVLVCLVLLYRWAARRTRPAGAAWLVAAAMVVLSPWLLRNYWTFNQLKATTTHGGYTLLLANNPLFYDHLRQQQHRGTWDSAPLVEAWELRGYSDDPTDELWGHLGRDVEQHVAQREPIDRNEIEDDRFAYRLACRYIRAEPAMFVRSCLVRIGRLWRLVPHQRDADESPGIWLMRIAAGLWYAVMFVLAAGGTAWLRADLLRGGWLWGLLLLASFTAVHTFYWSDMRMRAPLLPFVCLLAAAGSLGLGRSASAAGAAE